jgi:MerR family transcriptional regulator, copper efflux regulator
MSFQLPVHLEIASGKALRVGDLAKQTGKTVRALHLYEELGLLEPIHRSPAGYRLYSTDSVRRVRWIGKLQQMGFSLNEIRGLVDDLTHASSAPDAMRRVNEVFKEKLDETREQIRRLEGLQGELEASLDYLKTCDTCEPERVLEACSACDLHDCGERPPDLLAGFQPRPLSDGADPCR